MDEIDEDIQYIVTALAMDYSSGECDGVTDTVEHSHEVLRLFIHNTAGYLKAWYLKNAVQDKPMPTPPQSLKEIIDIYAKWKELWEEHREAIRLEFETYIHNLEVLKDDEAIIILNNAGEWADIRNQVVDKLTFQIDDMKAAQYSEGAEATREADEADECSWCGRMTPATEAELNENLGELGYMVCSKCDRVTDAKKQEVAEKERALWICSGCHAQYCPGCNASSSSINNIRAAGVQEDPDCECTQCGVRFYSGGRNLPCVKCRNWTLEEDLNKGGICDACSVKPISGEVKE